MEELSADARRVLLDFARRTVSAHLAGGRVPEPLLGPEMSRPAGAFVTLRRRSDDELRGCVGYVEPLLPLAETVARAALAAATHDGRFDPVTVDELSSLVLDISVLGPVRPIAPEEILVGTHGLIVRLRTRSGLLLPQVATAHSWSRDTFLDQTCHKAGLPPGAWRHPDAEVLGFTAIVFGED
jgi:AmmeMemoRadiSam system protein A